jgi:uncharacterized protein (TIGR02145 family)
MKKLIPLLCLVLISMAQHAVSQVSINSDGADPPASAMLEVKSTDKGFLPPKMTTTQMLAIQNPEMGLIIFNTELKQPCWYDGTEWIKFTGEAASMCGNSNVVYEGHVYHTVQIGNQCWFRENLNVGSMINGTTVPFNNGIIEKYCYNNDANNCLVYGGLYEWNEIMGYNVTEGSKGICPSGWHIPNNSEWTTLFNFLGGSGIAGGKMKEAGFTHWTSPNNAANESGFTALGAGAGTTDGSFGSLKNYAYFLSSTQTSSTTAYNYNLSYNNAYASQNDSPKAYRFSVRCLRDN